MIECFKPVIKNAIHRFSLYALQKDNFLDWTKFKAFADDKFNASKIKISVFERVENIVGKGENAGYQNFFLFSQCFQCLINCLRPINLTQSLSEQFRRLVYHKYQKEFPLSLTGP